MRHLIQRKFLVGAFAFLLGFGTIVLSGKVLFPRGFGTNVVPNGMYLQGLVVGLLSALLAVGLVLVYRTNRIINFAQGALGGFAATLTSELYQVLQWSYFAAVASGLVAAVLVSMLVEFGVIRRFQRSPRLILTVATIGVAQILGAVELAIPYLNRNLESRGFQTTLTSPLSGSFEFGLVRFKGDHLVVMVVAPLVLLGLALFFRYSRYGVAARAAAENDERARLLGIKVKRISLVVWAVAGLLSALTAILRAPILGFQFGAIAGQGLLLRALAAGVIGRMENLPVTAAAAILMTMAEQAIFFSFGRAGPAYGFFLAVIVVALILQHKRLARSDPQSSSWRVVQEIRRVPVELRNLPEVVWVKAAVFFLAFGALALLAFILPPSRMNLVSVIMIYAIVGISLVVLTGWGGNVSLGQWAFVGVGGLVAGKLATAVPLNFLATVVIASLSGAAVALVIGLPALRIRGFFLGATTLGFAVTAPEWFFQWDFLSTLGLAIPRPSLISSERAYYFVCLGGLLFALVAARNVRRTRLGRVLIAVRDNEIQGQAFGVRLTRSKLTGFALSGFLAAFAGSLYAYHQGFLDATRFRAEDSLLMFSMVVIGGMGSIAGAFLGAIYVRGTQYFLPNEFQLFVTGFGVMLLLLVFPGGLGQLMFNLRDRYLRWVAAKRRLLVPSLVADRRVEEMATPEGPAPKSGGRELAEVKR